MSEAKTWDQPTKVDKLTVVFGPSNIGDLLPAYDAIPDDFKRGNQWTRVIADWFFSGLGKDTTIVPKAGIDRIEALAHVRACLGSFEPKHEHKTAGCAYLLSRWFDQFGDAKAAPSGQEALA